MVTPSRLLDSALPSLLVGSCRSFLSLVLVVGIRFARVESARGGPILGIGRCSASGFGLAGLA